MLLRIGSWYTLKLHACHFSPWFRRVIIIVSHCLYMYGAVGGQYEQWHLKLVDIQSIFCGVLVLLFIIYTYRKIPKRSPGTHIFQRSFLRVLFLEWDICVTKLIGLAYTLAYTYKISRKKCYRIVFALFYYFIWGKFPPGALYSERRFN